MNAKQPQQHLPGWCSIVVLIGAALFALVVWLGTPKDIEEPQNIEPVSATKPYEPPPLPTEAASAPVPVPKPVATTPKPPAIPTVTAEKLASVFDANELAGDEQYGKKIVTVKGSIDNIGKSLGSPYVILAGYKYTDIHCSFAKEDISKLAKLSKGQTVRVRGTVSGMILSDVIVSNCMLVPAPSE